MAILRSIFSAARGPRTSASAAGNNAAATVTIAAAVLAQKSIHILEIVAGYTDGVTSKVLTISQGSKTTSYTVTGTGGFIDLTDPDWPAGGGALTITLPASGTANVIGYLEVEYATR